jgi:integrase/recombinase XerC
MEYEIIHIPAQLVDIVPALPSSSASPERIDLAVAAWLHAKENASGSKKTARAYRDTLEAFRLQLAQAGLDLDSEPVQVALLSQAFANQSTNADRGAVAPSTFNLRLAILSSFYRYTLKMGLVDTITTNPIDRVSRRKVQAYKAAHGHDPADVRSSLSKIERSTLAGARDYALLLMALTTGRRLSEIANLKIGDLTSVGGGRIEVHFRRCKGGKEMRDILAAPVREALYSWLQKFYQGKVAKDAPLWVSLQEKDGSYGRALSTRSLQTICEKRVGTSKFHSLRHTFAHSMEQSGAKVSDIQAKLGHSSLATTGLYLAALKRAENEHADDLAKLFGAG